MAKRRNSNRRRRRGGVSFLYKLLSVLLICACIIAALTLFFRVETILVTGQKRYTEEEVREATGVQNGDNLYLLNKHDIAGRVVEALPYIERTAINRKLPDTLVIQVQECGQPLAVVQDDSVWLVSPKGKIVDRTEREEGYGLISGCRLLAPSVGTPIALETAYTERQESLLALLGALEEAGMLEKADGIRLEDEDAIQLDYDGRFTVRMKYGADYPRKLVSLQAALDSGKVQDNMSGTFDMTLDNGRIHLIQNVR